MLNDIIKIWRLDLHGLIGFYENRKSQIEHLFTNYLVEKGKR